MRKLGRYIVLRPLGEGGMAKVFLAEDPSLRRKVAIKVIKEDLGRQEAWLGRFRAEAEAIARVRHPNIVEIFDIGAEEGRPFFVMEYVDGGSLGRLCRDPDLALPMPPWVAAAALEQAAEGLAAAHAAGVIHRDIKPDNLMVDGSGRVKIADFGLARLADRAGASGPTRTGEMVGSPHFMAPEQVRGEGTGPHTDLFALGSVFYYLLSGRHPFEGPNVHATLWRICDYEPEPLDGLKPDCPPELAGLARRLLDKDPARRGPPAEELAAGLRRLLAAQGLGESRLGLKGYFGDRLAPEPSGNAEDTPGARAPGGRMPAPGRRTLSDNTLALSARPGEVTGKLTRGGGRPAKALLGLALAACLLGSAGYAARGRLAGLRAARPWPHLESPARKGPAPAAAAGGLPVRDDAPVRSAARRTEFNPASGETRGYFADGRLESECRQPSGLPDGPCRYWYPDGKMREDGQWRAGKREGHFMAWYPDGRARSEGGYRDGEREGTWTFWKPDGQAIRQRFRAGRPVGPPEP